MILTPAPQHIGWGPSLAKPIPADHLQSRVDPGVVQRPQGYRLTVTDAGAQLVGHDPAGEFYGRQTWKQLCDQCNGQVDRAVDIDDWPDFLQRGVMLDISRDRVPRMDSLFAMIDRLASVKINQFQLYTEHTFAYIGHETVWSAASPMTPDQVRELDRYCKARFIELVPNQNCFGHMERWLKHPAYEPLAENADFRDGEAPGWFRGRPTSTLNAADPRSIQLIEDLLDQHLACFSSDTINIGCDETFEVGCGRGRPRAEAIGRDRLYFEFLRKIIRLCHQRGKTVQFWGDIILEHPALVQELKDTTDGPVIGLNWGYQPEHPYEKETRVFAEAEMPFYVCPSTHTFACLTARAESSLLNIQRSTEHGLARGATGVLNTIWGDFGHWQPELADDPGLIGGAAISWCRKANLDIDLAAALSTHWYKDPTGQIAKGLMRLCGVEGVLSSPLEWAMIFYDSPIEDGQLNRGFDRMPAWTLPMMKQVQQTIDEGRALIRSETDVSEGMRRRVDELDVTAGILRHASANVAARLEAGVGHTRELGATSRKGLAEELRPLVNAFSSHWLQRSRPGGLADSISRMRAAEGYYRG